MRVIHQRMFQQGKLASSFRRSLNGRPSSLHCPTCKLWISPIQYRNFALKEKLHAKSESTTAELTDEPVAYSLSKAAVWKARYTFGDVPEDKKPPEAQSIVVIISIAVFLVYFCILREENDLDVELTKTLSDRVEGFDEGNLHVGRVDSKEEQHLTSQ